MWRWSSGLCLVAVTQPQYSRPAAPPGSEDPRLPHAALQTPTFVLWTRHVLHEMAEGFELLSNDPDHQPALFPPKQTSPLSRKTLMESPPPPIPGGSGARPGSVSVRKSAQTGDQHTSRNT